MYHKYTGNAGKPITSAGVNMNYREFGSQHADTIILLHGGGLSWWNYAEAAEMLQNEYHIILPVLDGHAGSDNHFSTIERCASDIITWIRTNIGNSVCMIGGLSLGGQVLLEILSQQPAICQHALIESAMVIPSKCTHAMIAPAFGCSYPLIRQKWFARLQFKSLRIKSSLFDDYYRDTCAVTKKDMIAFLKANTAYALKDSIQNTTADIHIFCGAKETRGIRKSAALIHECIPASTLHILPDMYHADFSINHAPDYVRTVIAICKSASSDPLHKD